MWLWAAEPVRHLATGIAVLKVIRQYNGTGVSLFSPHFAGRIQNCTIIKLNQTFFTNAQEAYAKRVAVRACTCIPD